MLPFETQLFILIACVVVLATAFFIYKIFLNALSEKENTASYDDIIKEAKRKTSNTSRKTVSTNNSSSEVKSVEQSTTKEDDMGPRTFVARTPETPSGINASQDSHRKSQKKVNESTEIASSDNLSDFTQSKKATPSQDSRSELQNQEDASTSARTFNRRTPATPSGAPSPSQHSHSNVPNMPKQQDSVGSHENRYTPITPSAMNKKTSEREEPRTFNKRTPDSPVRKD